MVEPRHAHILVIAPGSAPAAVVERALIKLADESRTNDVMPRLKKMGQWAIDAFTVCKMGPHERHEGELKSLIDNSKRLAQALQVMP